MSSNETADAATPAAPARAGEDRVLVIFGGLVLVMLLAALDSTIVSTALPTIVGELGGLDRLAWVVTAYLLAQTIVTPLYGKLGDLYGRKGVLQTGIVVFLVGSALCGMSGSMTQLILFRFVQGLGGGGLMVTTQAVVGDVVPPRERGRYQGIFGAVFGLASVAGPLLGGYFTTQLSWRWIFYVNLPLGLVALGVLAVTLPARSRRVEHAIDYAGAGLLAIALAAVVLATDLGGSAYAWTSPVPIGLGLLAVAALAGFLFAESRAKEPVLPLRLFRNRSFVVTVTVGLIVGFALFGSVTYLPIYLQVVRGSTPTSSGLQMLPMMAGMLLTSIGSGQIISRTGRYRAFPIVGTALVTAGLFALSRLSADTGAVATGAMMLTLGLGLGLVMQVLVIAAQNAVAYEDLGVATSGATLFRLVGGSLGTAALGAIFAAALASRLAAALPPGADATGLGAQMTADAVARLAPGVRDAYFAAFTGAIGTVFLVATCVAVAGFALAWLLPERPLRETVAATTGEVGVDAARTFPLPTGTDPLAPLERGLAALADRDVRRRHIERVVAIAGLDLTPAAAWLLVRLERDPALDPDALARDRKVEPEIVRAALADLVERGLVRERSGRREITADGCDVFARLVAARRKRLDELFAEWSPDERAGLAETLRRLAHELVPDGPRPDYDARR